MNFGKMRKKKHQEYKRQENEILITCKKTNYLHYLYDERIGLSEQYACSSLVAGCLLETSDGYYIIGELADNTSFPHCMQVSGGSADDNDIENEEIDIYNTIIRECQEELYSLPIFYKIVLKFYTFYVNV